MTTNLQLINKGLYNCYNCLDRLTERVDKIEQNLGGVYNGKVVIDYGDGSQSEIDYNDSSKITYNEFIEKLPEDTQSKVIGIETDKDGYINLSKK